MANVSLLASSSLRNEPPTKLQTLTKAFKKELSYLLSSLRTAKPDDYHNKKSSNTIFKLWNEYESKLPVSYFTEQQLLLGDILYEQELYSLARTHCYGRYLQAHYDNSVSLLNTVLAMKDSQAIIVLLRALMGEAMCDYHTILHRDPKLMVVSSKRAVLTVLESLQIVSQAALSRELLYWIVLNCLQLMYSIARPLLVSPELVLPFFLWGAVAMESSVPLMASKYLHIRTNFYSAVCTAYNVLKAPHQAELFARRALDRVHELAQLEGLTSTTGPSHSTQFLFREASVKLEVVIFKRSVFLSHKKVKPGFRPKIRPSISELLQLQSPRSPTERLIAEMFTGRAACFLAVLETLKEPSRRALHKSPPPTPLGCDLDQESITDVYQELFCLGLDLTLRALEDPTQTGSLLTLAVEGRDVIPVNSLVWFVRVAYSYEQREIVNLLAQRLVQITQVLESCEDRALGKSLELLLKLESLDSAFKSYRSTQATPNTGAVTGASFNEPQEERTSADELFSKLQDTLSLLTLSVSDKCLLRMDHELLLDAGVMVWEIVQPAFSTINNHQYNSCKQFLSHSIGKQYVVLLAELIEVFDVLELWLVDPVLYGELCLKLASLYEARAELRTPVHPLEGYTLFYDRGYLLETLARLQRDVRAVERARNVLEEPKDQLEALHTQFLVAETRVQVKLSTTIPPPTPQDKGKPSSLHSKVIERQEKVAQRARVLAELPAATISVPSIAQLKQNCGANGYRRALLTMLQASLDPNLNYQAKEALLREALDCLVIEDHPSHPHTSTPSHPNTSTSSYFIPPPQLLNTTSTSMTFKPPEFGKSGVVYCKLFGRRAQANNTCVRLSDHSLPGLGVEVPVGRPLCVHGLESNVEYVFAVGGFSSSGQLFGLSATGPPILSSYSFPTLIAWGLLCKSAYECGLSHLALKACEQLYKVLLEPSTQPVLLREFVQASLIHAQLKIAQKKLFPDRLPTDAPLKNNQHTRLSLGEHLLSALTASAALNDSGLSLQIAVMIYGVLAPFLQSDIRCTAAVEQVLHCFSVLTEVPDALSLHRHTESLHHMIAVIGYFLGKVAIDGKKKGLFSLMNDNFRGLLILSMPQMLSCTHNMAPPEGLQQASLLSGSINPTSDVSTGPSGQPSLLPPLNNKRKKTRAKKLMNNVDDVADESKSAEFRAFEAFLLSHAPHHICSEDLDLTGHEDPVLLHAVIASQTSNNAHREVHKFRRRPQYLEYFVQLAAITLSKGHTDRVLEWCKESFTWLVRRNELLLSTKPPVPQHKLPRAMSRRISTTGSALQVSNRRTSVPLDSQQKARMSQELSNIGSTFNARRGTRRMSMARELSCLSSSLNLPQLRRQLRSGGQRMAIVKPSSSKMGRLAPIRGPGMEIRVTREDIETKAITVLTVALPILWKTHKARKRLRSVCQLELPWRAQANIIQASCYLEGLVKEITTFSNKPQPRECSQTFDTAGVIIDGVVPIYSPALSGNLKASDHVEKLSGLSTLPDIMLAYRHAVTLAHRGSHWLLLQNTVRALLNALSSLLVKAEQICDDTIQRSVLAALYGEALRPLYCAALGLLDLLSFSSYCESVCPEVLPLKACVEMDQSPGLGLSVMKKAVFLALHVLYVHQHWEKVISIIIKFDDLTKHSWGEQLCPLLSRAQEKLAVRLACNRPCQQAKLEPAAHLDPTAYNVYVATACSLGRTRVPIEDSTASRCGHSVGGVLRLARSLRSQYMASRVGLGEVTAAYDKSVQILAQGQDSDRLAQASNELGDLLLPSNTSSAGSWWQESLCLLLGTREILTKWRTCINTLLSSAGLWGSLLATQIAYKLARYVHYPNLSIRLEYTLMAATFIKASLDYSLPSPTSELSFIHYHQQVFPGIEVFSDEQRLSISGLLAAVSWTAQELLSCCHSLVALPVLWFYRYLAEEVCRDLRAFTHAKVLLLIALTKLHRFDEALSTLSELLSGCGLPQASGGTNKHLEIHFAFCDFTNSLPLNDPNNIKCLHLVLDRALSPVLSRAYGPINKHLLSLARAQLYIALANCFPGPSLVSIISRATKEQQADSPQLSTPVSPGATTGASSSASTSSSRSLARRSATYRRLKHDVKHNLLENAEKLLSPLAQIEEDQHLEIKIKSLLGLAKVAWAYGQQINCYQLSMSALRVIQNNDQCSNSRLWLQALAQLSEARSGEHCTTGCEQSKALGDHKQTAYFHYLIALHCLREHPPPLPTITTHCQIALEQLEKCTELSYDTSLLRCRVSLLLADATCVSGVSGTEIVKVFHGLADMLRKELSVDSDPEQPNLYMPHRSLLAATLLRLTHTLCLTGSADSALSPCNEGLLMLTKSSLNDPCLQAELLIHKGWLLSLLDQHAGFSTLTEAATVIAEAGVNHKLAVCTLYKLAELSLAMDKGSRQDDSVLDSPSAESNKQGEGRGKLRESTNKNNEQLPTNTWLLIKLATRISQKLNTLTEFVSQVHNEDATKPLSSKELSELPDFVLLDLCSSKNTLCDKIPPVKKLLPSNQAVITTGLTVFKIASYVHELLYQCHWQKNSLDIFSSNWQIHHHSLTAQLQQRAKALVDFLVFHSVQLRSLKIPVAPGTDSKLSQDPAGDTELTVVWTQPFPLEADGEKIVGFFALNAKLSRGHSASTGSQSPGLQTHVVKTSVQSLVKLYELWTQLSDMVTEYLDNKARPLSRSPSKQRKSVKVPTEIVECCTHATEQLKQILGIVSSKSPRLELVNVSKVAPLLKPFTQNTVRGEPYHFFGAMFD